MKKNEILEKVADAIREATYQSDEIVDESMYLINDIAIDSLELQDVFSILAEEFEIDINIPRLLKTISEKILLINQGISAVDCLNEITKQTGLTFAEEDSLSFSKMTQNGTSTEKNVRDILEFLTVGSIVDCIQSRIGD